MYEACILRQHTQDVTLGPTDTRDEAARLARAWIQANPVDPGVQSFGRVVGVEIRRVDNNDNDND